MADAQRDHGQLNRAPEAAPSVPARPGHRPDVDGLRAIAILSVVAYHAGVPGIPGGFTGVDVFFVVSGFVITQLLRRELQGAVGISLIGFYARRARRLLPALALVVATTLAAGFVLLPPFGEKAAMARSSAAAMAFVANEWFRVHSGGYFDSPAATLPLLHLWSLSVEEQFYLAWPLLLTAGALLARRARLPPMGVLAAGVVALTLASFSLSVWLADARPDRAFYFAGSRAWELGIGAFIAIVAPAALPFRLATALGILGLGLIAAGCVGITAQTPFPGVAALLPAAGTGLLIYAGSTRTVVTRGLGSRPMVQIGLLSYSWYLWHWPLLALARSRRMGEPDALVDGALAVLALGLAWATLRWVENPVRYGTFARQWTPRATVAAGVATLALLAGASALVIELDERLPRSPQVEAAFAILHDRSPHQGTCARAPRQWDGVVPRPECIVGTPPPAVAIWGDSHADAWAPMLDALPGETGYVQVSMNACPPLLGNQPQVPGVRQLANCAPFNERVAAYLDAASAEGLRGVVLAARWTSYDGMPNLSLQDGWIGYFDRANRSGAGALASLRTGLEATLAALDKAGLRTLIVLSAPEFRHPIYRCVLERPAGLCNIERSVFESHRQAVTDVIRSVSAHFAQARLLDPAPLLCAANECPAITGATATSWDDDHPSASAAHRVAGASAADLAWLQGSP